MMSILIPVYEWDVRGLVRELVRQGQEFGETLEILVYDDASSLQMQNINRSLRALSGVRYRELEANLGRAAIRNLLAREATFSTLVYLDADGKVGPDFLRKYQTVLAERKDTVIVGGRSYANVAPASPQKKLHWWYGSQREATGAAKRNEQPYLGFQSNNFLVPRRVVLGHPFDESISGYGHEDTLWGQQLAENDVPILHIENAVQHLGLETTELFLTKQRKAVENLREILVKHPSLRTKLSDAPRWMGKLAQLLPEQQLKAYLISTPKPTLRALDILKLKWYHRVD